MKNMLQTWINNNHEILIREGFVSAHVDEILNRTLSKDEVLKTSIGTFFTLIEYIANQKEKLIPLLVVPLQDLGNRITFAVPKSIEDILNDIRISEEPPSLYLMLNHPNFGLEMCEEYKIPLSFDLVDGNDNKKIFVYYREFRCEQAIESQWEFSRCLYVNLRPES